MEIVMKREELNFGLNVCYRISNVYSFLDDILL